MTELPGELVAKPLALVGLTGLDLSNPMHRSIWDAFSNNRRPDSLPVQFKQLSYTHEFPTVKPKVCQCFSARRLKEEWLIVVSLLIKSEKFVRVVHP